MSLLFITEYHTPTRIEPGRQSELPITRAGDSKAFGAGTKTVRVVAEEPCLIGFDTDMPHVYLPADKPEKFNVERVKTICVRAV